jgi:hypothetical protein
LPIWHAEDILNAVNPMAAPVARASITVDAVETLRSLSSWGVSAVLHGHQHRHSVLTYEDHCRSKRPIHVLAAGSAGDKTANRQFFVYEIRRGGIDVLSYEQSTDNPTHFEESWQKTLTLSKSLAPDSTPVPDMCQVGASKIAEIQGIQAATGHQPTNGAHDSDLYYLFMTVVDCERARKAIRQLVFNYHVPGPADQSYLSLHGMYDLLGKWDLAVRLRVGTAVKWGPFFDRLQDDLKGLLFAPGHHRSLDWFKVDRELSGFSESAVCISEQHRLFGNKKTSDYERDRCQKGFLYVELQVKGVKKDLVERLRSKIEKPSHDIVMGVCECADALIIEIFMTCSQSGHVRMLNREIGPVVAEYGCQKYTLLCYEYDEEPASNALQKGFTSTE